MKINTLNNSPKVPFDLEAFILHSEDKIELVHLLLKPEEELQIHKNPFDVIFFVIEGTGLLTVENESMCLKPSDTIKVISDKDRAWKNQGNNDLRILVIKLL